MESMLTAVCFGGWGVGRTEQKKTRKEKKLMDMDHSVVSGEEVEEGKGRINGVGYGLDWA